MKLPDISPEHSPEHLLSDILTYVDEAEAFLAQGKTVQLAGLDTVVDALCQRILTLKDTDIAEYAPELTHLNTRLDALATAITKAKDALNDTLDSLDKRQRAAKAYLNVTDK